MRKKKPDNLKAKQVTISLPESFLCYCDQPSKRLATAIAEDVLGIHINDFPRAYKDDTRFKRDPWEQEYIRAARWILESEVTKITAHGDHGEHYKYDLDVEWLKTGDLVTVSIYNGEGGFHHVIYDSVDFIKGSGLSESTEITNLADLQLTGFKWRVTKAWLKNSWVK